MLAPRRSAAAWPRRRRHEPCRRLLCPVPPLGHRRALATPLPRAARAGPTRRCCCATAQAAVGPAAAGLAPPAPLAAPRAMARA